MKTLSIIESAYRATIEEQDDTIVWLTHAMKGAGADLGVLLRGNAVNYAALGQDAAGLAFGGWRQTQPPRLADDITALVAKGVAVYAIAEDLAERGQIRGNGRRLGLPPVDEGEPGGILALHQIVDRVAAQQHG